MTRDDLHALDLNLLLLLRGAAWDALLADETMPFLDRQRLRRRIAAINDELRDRHRRQV